MPAIMSRCRDPENRSNKWCVCGGHNHNNPKRNMNHNATYSRHSIKLNRKLKQEMEDDMREYYDHIYSPFFLEGEEELLNSMKGEAA